MICQQCNQAVMLDMASDHLPPWCQRCGADIRDALYGANAGAAALPTSVLTSSPDYDSRPLPVREKRRYSPEADAPPTDYRVAALLLGVLLFVAACALAAFQFLT